MASEQKKKKRRKNKNIMFDTHLMLFGTTRIFVYTAIWLILVCFHKTALSFFGFFFAHFSRPLIIFNNNRNDKSKENGYLYKCEAFYFD